MGSVVYTASSYYLEVDMCTILFVHPPDSIALYGYLILHTLSGLAVGVRTEMASTCLVRMRTGTHLCPCHLLQIPVYTSPIRIYDIIYIRRGTDCVPLQPCSISSMSID